MLQCNRLRRSHEGEKTWVALMGAAKSITEKEFLDYVDPIEILDHDEHWEEFISGCRGQDKVSFYKSINNTYIFQTCGFEFFWEGADMAKTPLHVLESIKEMEVDPREPNRLLLPDPKISQWKNYPAVKKVLMAAGGKYVKNGFDFQYDALTVKVRLLSGEDVNDKKKYQQFFTPGGLADRVADLANIEEHHSWLEPSAGTGAIANSCMVRSSHYTLIEIMQENCDELLKRGYEPDRIHNHDFLDLTEKDLGLFDRIIANPPFTKNQDIIHMDHMWRLLKPGGRIVCITSRSWINGSQKKQKAFKATLTKLGAKILDIPAGEFKESGTSVPTAIVILDK